MIATFPFVLVPALLASGRVGTLAAGVAGLLATVAALLLLRSPNAATVAMLSRETLAGIWLAAQAVGFILGGLFFYCCVRASEPGLITPARCATNDGTALNRRTRRPAGNWRHRALRDEQGLLARTPQLLRSAWPYIVLTLILVATRTLPPSREALQEVAPLPPLAGEAAIAPLYHPAT